MVKLSKNLCLKAITALFDKSVMVIGIDREFDVVDDSSAVLPVPEFAKSIELTVGDVFGWLKKKRFE